MVAFSSLALGCFLKELQLVEGKLKNWTQIYNKTSQY